MSKHNKLVYIDYDGVMSLYEKSSYSEFVAFFENKLVIAIDDESYYYLMELRQENKKIKNNIKRLS